MPVFEIAAYRQYLLLGDKVRYLFKRGVAVHPAANDFYGVIICDDKLVVWAFLGVTGFAEDVEQGGAVVVAGTVLGGAFLYFLLEFS